MSVRITLDNPPQFYTNLDVVSGKVVLGINRPETVGAVIVKLEGESKTALGSPDSIQNPYPQPTVRRRSAATESSQIIHENHKVLYKVLQVYPDEDVPAYSVPVVLQPGQHSWDFKFRVPFNNACGDPTAMAKIGGLAGAGGFAGPSLFGMGGIRLMDGSKQLFYRHVTRTLPPSFTGFPREAEIRYYVKVTIQRPGLFKENFRHQLGFKFLPIEPPRPPSTNQEAYARRPFTFRPKSPAFANGAPSPQLGSCSSPSPSSTFSTKRNSLMFGRKPTSSQAVIANTPPPTPSEREQPPSIEISARLPHPSILTCNKTVPLRLIAKKLVASHAECYLASIQIELVGSTVVRCQDLVNTETTRWVIVSRTGLAIPLQQRCDDAVGTETEINKALWEHKPLPNTVMPSFVTCNLKRAYSLELKLGVSWGKPPGATTPIPNDDMALLSSKTSILSLKKATKGKAKNVPHMAQTIFLPLHFSSVQVYSGLTPPESLAQAVISSRKQQTPQANGRLPPRSNGTSSTPALPPRQQYDPLYPPQLRPGQTTSQASTATSPPDMLNGTGVDPGVAPPSYDEAPPSYDEAMAEAMPGPVVSAQERPAYSGETNENAPDSLPEKTS